MTGVEGGRVFCDGGLDIGLPRWGWETGRFGRVLAGRFVRILGKLLVCNDLGLVMNGAYLVINCRIDTFYHLL